MIKKLALFMLIVFVGVVSNACENEIDKEEIIKEFAYYRVEYSHHDYTGLIDREVARLSKEIWIFDTDESIRHNEGTYYIFFDSDNEIVRLGKADYAIYEHQDELVYLVKATLAIRKIVYAYDFLRVEINLLIPEVN